MVLKGYMALGGGEEVIFPHFTQYEGEGVGPKRGRWKMDTDLKTNVLSIPSRDKQVQLFADEERFAFAPLMATIDSTEGQNYRAKLRQVLQELSPRFVGVVNNISTSTHRSLAFITGETPIYFYGLFDTKHKGAYLAWGTDPMDIQPLLLSDSDPLRYLIYRFPILMHDALFLPQERVCALWYTWIKRADYSALQPFNALERRLFGQPLAVN
jgi:hypothetical protein